LREIDVADASTVGGKVPEKVDMTDLKEQASVTNFYRHIDFNLVNMFFNPEYGRCHIIMHA